jgi:hypothetical protein
MIAFIFSLIFINAVWADPFLRWTTATQIVEQHEFYQNNEVITKPQNSWQTLFGILYQDATLKDNKDCLFYRVPGEEGGILKLRSISPAEKCDDYQYQQGDKEWTQLKALQYTIEDNYINITLTHAHYRIERWDIPLLNVFERKKPTNSQSSAEYRAAKMIFLTPSAADKSIRPVPVRINIAKLCHAVADDCREIMPSECWKCPEGWYEIPNGCPQGPKYCGVITCGQKNRPACRRGLVWQRKEADYGCRSDHSFAYCAEGLTIQCQGALPYCI